MREIILSSKNLCKSFANNGGQNHVLDHVTLEIYEKDFTVIMGASGSGKSTLLYCLSGMDSITSGAVYYRQQEFSHYSEREMAALRAVEFGFVFQQSHLVSHLTLMENIVVPGYLGRGSKFASGKGKKKEKAENVKLRALELLELMNIADAKDRLPSQVSGGEAQRAAIARAVISEPGIILADEPTGALNRKNTEEVLNLLTKLNQQKLSVLMVTHDIHAAARADRLLYLDDGRISGEMTMSKFEPQEARNREVQINAWLSAMEW